MRRRPSHTAYLCHALLYGLVGGLLLAPPMPAVAAVAAVPARVLVYGDSNSWGWQAVASGFPASRLPAGDRWPEVMRQALGARAEVLVDALSGRTVDRDHVAAIGQLQPADFNGLRGVAASVARELPLDLVVVMLGTNDVARDQGQEAGRIAAGMAALVRSVRGSDGGVLTGYPAPRVLVVVPAPLGDVSRTPIGERFDAASVLRSRQLEAAYRMALAGIDGVAVIDAGHLLGAAAGIDGLHLSAPQQRWLGVALADAVAATVSPSPLEEIP